MTTSAVAHGRSVVISATYAGVTATANLTVRAPGSVSVEALILDSDRQSGGCTLAGTVTLTGTAPTDIDVLLTSDNPAAHPPASVAVTSGARSARFSMTLAAVAAASTVTIGATYGDTMRSDTFTLVPAGGAPAYLHSLRLGADRIRGGDSKVATVVLDFPAGCGGATVPLSSSLPGIASIPSSVLVPEGAISAPFTIQTSPVTAATSTTISATGASPTGSGNVTRSGVIRVLAEPAYTVTTIAGAPLINNGGRTPADFGVSFLVKDISDAGHLVGSEEDPGTFAAEAVLWHNGVTTRLGKLPGDEQSGAEGVDIHGEVVGWSQGRDLEGSPIYRAVLWRNGTMAVLNPLPGDGGAQALAINDQGQIVGRSGRTGVVWRDGTITDVMCTQPCEATDINEAGEVMTSAAESTFQMSAINNAGEIVGGSYERGTPYGTLRRGTNYIDLNELIPADYWLYDAEDINDSGQIVGRGFHNGSNQTLLLTPRNNP